MPYFNFKKGAPTSVHFTGSFTTETDHLYMRGAQNIIVPIKN